MRDGGGRRQGGGRREEGGVREVREESLRVEVGVVCLLCSEVSKEGIVYRE